MASKGIFFKRVISSSKSNVSKFLNTLSLMMLLKEIFKRQFNQTMNGVPNTARLTVPREIFIGVFGVARMLRCNVPRKTDMLSAKVLLTLGSVTQ